MDFNPLDILAAAALGEKDAPSEVNTSKQASNAGQEENSESGDSKDADEDSDKEMGRTTSNNLKHSHSAKDTEQMAPQKMPWSPETLMPDHIEGIVNKQDKFSLDDLLQDVKKGVDVKLQNIIDRKIPTDALLEAQHDANNSSDVTLKLNTVSSNTADVKPSDEESTSQTAAQISSENAKEESTKLEDCSWQDESNLSEDAADLGDVKLCGQTTAAPGLHANECVILDHPYALPPGKLQPSAMLDDDDDIDVCSENSPFSEDSEQRYHNPSLDCNYLKFGILEGVSASTLDLYRMSKSANMHFKRPSSSSSASSPTADLVSRTPHSAQSGDETGDVFSGMNSPASVSSDVSTAHSPVRLGVKCGKFKIGTFASFSSGNLELEKFLKSRQQANSKKLNVGIPADIRLISSPLNSPSAYPNIYPLLQSPSADWDRSEAGSETQDDSSDAKTPLRMSPDFTKRVKEWSHPVFHDHDYCVKDAESISFVDDFRKLNGGKRKYTKKKNKEDGVNHEKIMKAKYLKKELLRQDNIMKSVSELEPMCIDHNLTKTNPVGRPRKRPFDKIIDEEIDPEVGTKLKITGKFQDQYVYYLSKSSRTTARRRHPPTPSFASDKIIVPAPKPGDIVVPHLTDADIETVRLKGRGALNLPERPHMTNHLPIQSLVASLSHASEFISDVDSHIVSTILSMESDSLASPVTSHPPDISNLNPNQPDLTESLRLMSGDPSITSEHVLNYLLSVVKDEALLGSGSGFDTSSTALFPSLHSDSMCVKNDHMGDGAIHQDLSSLDTSGNQHLNSGHDLLDIAKSVQSTGSFDNPTLLSTAHIHGRDHFVHTVHKDSLDENVSLADDLSSFMSNSQGTSSSNTTQDGDSHSSLKSMFGSDLSSLGTPQLSSSVPRLTSIEKTLDYLGVRDEDMKLDDSVFNTKMDNDADSSQALTPVSSTSADDTPWIVTVTLYFNDVPAIMINNQPYIRLVDIHKQILPAKDTGILKKRCQLLKIPVLNCTEMQRYFLVQYGRAYNSKSTLIVSKEQATNLVTYYAFPQPRIGKVDESHPRRPSSSGGSEGGRRSPVTHLIGGGVKKRGSKSSRKVAVSVDAVMVGAAVSQCIQTPEPPTSHGKRTRHKKVNYLELLKGEEKEKSSSAAILETIESVVKSAPDHVHEGKSNKLSVKKKMKGDQSGSVKHCGTKKKLTPMLQKKNTDKKCKIKKESVVVVDHKAKSNKTKIGSSVKPIVEKDIDICSDVDSSDCVDLAQAKKFRPLKLKVNSLLNFAGQRKGPSSSKKGLFSCTNSAVSPDADRSLRVLAVAHQAALSANNAESHLPSQPADIHLDLFIKSNSACVRCDTCSQFLSVPHFMRHHHVPMDSEWLATEAAHRILRSICGKSFHHLQEAIGGFGEADDETESDDDYSDDDHDDHPSFKLSEPLSARLNAVGCSELQLKSIELARLSSICDGPRLTQEDAGSAVYTRTSQTALSHSKPVSYVTTTQTTSLTIVGQHHGTEAYGLSSAGLLGGDPASSNLRTSSRKRKSKQLFSIENYYIPHKLVVDEDSGLSGKSLDVIKP
ncbi:unnamed protein product [Candidula unifasciata]|uniref:Putative Dachshund-homology domain-containing protein n=1 Tax=Candidula unifasciata TaxID=100452 RepID=A0A8S3YSE1_9EUPU|nr:unnamed protein product [Candidula unifasciata]